MTLKTLILMVLAFLQCTFSQEIIDKIPGIAEKLISTAVTIIVYDSNGKQVSHGSGFIINADGEIITNYHVIRNASPRNIEVLTNQLGRHEVEDIIAVDPDVDLALLNVKAQKLSFAPLAMSDSLRIGEMVMVIGTPVLVNLQNTVSTGIVSQIRTEGERTHIQFTAPASPGNSGGPIFNSSGEIVGVVRAGYAFADDRPAQNVNLGIPVRYVRELLANRKNSPVVKSVRRAALDSILVFLEGHLTIPLVNSFQTEVDDAKEVLKGVYRHFRFPADTLKILEGVLRSLEDDTIEAANTLKQLFANGLLNRFVTIQEWMAYWAIGLREEMIQFAEVRRPIRESVRMNLIAAGHFNRLGNRDSTVFYIERARQLSSGGTALSDIGSYYWSMEQFDKCVEVFKRLVAADPRNPEWQCEVGTLLLQVGTYQQRIRGVVNRVQL